ncbi:hypothetical protein GYMLUDRAFT_33139 [Collybiopsis luxurians FD-317 M1]|nr:hypothetical protein GYMLUDRAFT_33139 [Collybiopsis luxurians FD-317 M1]
MSSTPTNKSDEQGSSRLSDIALRKRKNASAQAAFRQRRNNYISTLEETVINLEQVVRVLQDSCRETQAEVQELQQENARLRTALKDRETFWRAMWRKIQGSETEEFPSYPSPPSTTTYNTQYQDSSTSLDQYTTQYSNWPPQTSSHSSNSPQFAESPTLTAASDMFRYTEDQKVSLGNIEPVAPYMFSSSRSISPSSSTAPSSSSTSLTSSFPPYSFDATGAVQDRADFDYRRQSAHSADITLSGGMADVSGHSNDGGVRYRLSSNRRMDGNLLPVLSPLTGGTAASENGSQHGSDNGDSFSNRAHPRRTAGPSAPSRSPSPGVAPLSGTLAVIKASAFGALRRTRVRNKKPATVADDDPAQVARDVLESRGIVSADQPGPTSLKRRRLSSDDDLDS